MAEDIKAETLPTETRQKAARGRRLMDPGRNKQPKLKPKQQSVDVQTVVVNLEHGTSGAAIRLVEGRRNFAVGRRAGENSSCPASP